MSNRKIRKLFLEELNEDEVERLGFDWPVWARLKQRPPVEAWRTWLVLGGRGAGKTRTGAEWVKGVALADPHFPGDAAGRIALVGESYDDIRDVMIEGESGILAVHRNSERPDWISSRRELVWANGTTAKLFSSADPEGLRGNQFGAAWADGADSWGNTDVPLDANSERYLVRIRDQQFEIVREIEMPTTQYVYFDTQLIEDFGNVPDFYELEVAQIGDNGNPGAFAKIKVSV